MEVDASQGEFWLIRGAFLGGLGPQGLLSSGGLGKWTSLFRTWQNRQTIHSRAMQGQGSRSLFLPVHLDLDHIQTKDTRDANKNRIGDIVWRYVPAYTT